MKEILNSHQPPLNAEKSSRGNQSFVFKCKKVTLNKQTFVNPVFVFLFWECQMKSTDLPDDFGESSGVDLAI